MQKTKKKREWKHGRGMKGTVRAALTHHPEKFSKEACKSKKKKGGKLCPYAVFAAKKKKGFEPHYKDQESTLKGTPVKKKKFKKDKKTRKFREWVQETHPNSKIILE